MSRTDDYSARKAHLSKLSDAELKDRFWELTGKVVEPLLDLAKTYTSPSIERAVLLRMGFNSMECSAIVKHCEENKLLGKGAGHMVWRLAQIKNIPTLEAGRLLTKGQSWNELTAYFGGAKA